MIAGFREEDVMLRLREYIAALEPSRRTPDKLYRQRLAVCESCPKLKDGCCRECGCFVLYRAAVAANGCPDLPDRWNCVVL